MRKILPSLAVLGLVTVGLVGCSQPGTQTCPPSDRAVTELITVTGETDEAPNIDMYTPFVTTDPAFEVLVAGDGTPITDNRQVVVLDVTLAGGETGETVVSSGYEGDLSQAFPVSRWLEIFPGMEDALHCAAEGSRVVVALPADDIAAETAAGVGLGQDESAVAVVDVRRVFLPKADGANQFNVDQGVPTVVRAPDGRPGIIVPDAAPPEDLVVQTIKKGSGEVVTGDDPVRVHYTGLTWDDRAVFETTWDSEPKSVTLEDMVPGFAEALSGQTVGSQVMVVIPPEQGYGDQEQASIPANSTLVFVIDILGIDQAPPAP